MSLESKVSFLHSAEEKLSTEVTAADLAKVMEVLSVCLDRYEMEKRDADTGELDDVFDAYISAMRVQGRSTKTIDRYTDIIRRMLQSTKVNTRQITVYHLRKYIADEKARGVSDSTLEGNRQVFSAYFNWLQREGLLATNPTANLGCIKCRRKVRNAYSDIEIEKLKRQCKHPRDAAILSFLLSTGCRVSEVVQLNRDDVDIEHLECTVLGKGNKERIVYIDSVTGMLLKAYLSQRTDNEDALFVSLKDPFNRLTAGAIRTMLKKLGCEANVEDVYPHKFRRTKATNLIKHGMPIQEVAALLGHEKLDTTTKYIVMNRDLLKSAYQRYS